MHQREPGSLHAYSLPQKKWTKATIENVGWSFNIHHHDYAWGAGGVYARGFRNEEGALLRFDVSQKKWEDLPIAGHMDEFWLLLNPTDGVEDGFLTVRRKRLPLHLHNLERFRYTIQRRMLRNVETAPNAQHPGHGEGP
ncbi:hypothetical protein M3Y99_01182400 [Aphelenchoides fujianensis]|nr:hypothetical protein M3Y99_01182400 [Aphelenchoides fujianensis]